MKKRLGAFILAMLMILSICPVTMAEDATAPEATSTASAYDVRIEGNFTSGLSVTAKYDYLPGADGCDETSKDDAYYTWYRLASNGYAVTLLKEGYGSDGGNTYTITDADAVGGDQNYGHKNFIFVSVQTKNENGWGEPKYSNVYGPNRIGLNTSSIYAGSTVWSAHIVPKNAAGTMELGDEIAVRYTFYNIGGFDDASTFQWFVKDAITGEETPIEGATSKTYTIGKEAVGKYIGCTVSSNSTNNRGGSTATALTHYGNVGHKTGLKSTHSGTGFGSVGKIPMNQILSDGTSRHGAAGFASAILKWKDYEATLIYDMGEIVDFDSIFFSMWTTGTFNPLIEYSSDNVTWNTFRANTAAIGGENEFTSDVTKRARYFKLSGACLAAGTEIAEFYPFVKQDAKVTVPEAVGVIEDGAIKVKELNKSSSALLAEITVASLIDDSALTPIYVDAEGNQINEDFAINTNTTAKLQVTGKNGIKLQYALSFQKLEENLTVNCTPGVAYLEEGKIYVDTWKTSSADLANAVTAVSAVDGNTLTPVIVDSEGNEAEAFEIDENTTGKFVRFINTYGDSYDYEIAYKHLASNSMQYIGKASYVWSTVDFSKYNKEVIYQEAPVTIPTGKYILKSELNVPDGYTVSLQARQGTTLQGGWISGILKFDDATKTIIISDKDTGFKYVPGKTYAVEYLIDYDDLKLSNLYEVYTEIRVDGIVIEKGARTIQRAATVGLMSPYFAATKTNEAAADQHIKATNSSFRKVKSRDAFAVTTNNYALSLKSGDTAVNDIEPGTYTIENTVGVYKGTKIDTIVAVYNVSGSEKTLNKILVNPAQITVSENQEIKAYCFSDILSALTKVGEWK